LQGIVLKLYPETLRQQAAAGYSDIMSNYRQPDARMQWVKLKTWTAGFRGLLLLVCKEKYLIVRRQEEILLV